MLLIIQEIIEENDIDNERLRNKLPVAVQLEKTYVHHFMEFMIKSYSINYINNTYNKDFTPLIEIYIW